MTLAVLVVAAGAVVPCLLAVLRGDPLQRLAALEALSVAVTVAAVIFADAVGRSAYLDVALVLALLSFAGSLVFARFFGRVL
jgi:multicomponent Na+:H+ antiporter subunit F